MFRWIAMFLIGRHLWRRFGGGSREENREFGEEAEDSRMSKKKKNQAEKKSTRFWTTFGIVTAAGLILFQPGTFLGVMLMAGLGYLAGKGVSTMSEGMDTTPHNEPGNRSVHYRTEPEPEEEPVRSATGEPAADALIERGLAMVEQIRRENVAITDPVLTAQMSELEERCKQIFQTVADTPDKASQIRKYMDYYLPTTLKMLANYRTMSQRGVSYATLQEARNSLVRAMNMVLQATRKLQDNLYRGEMLDISTDIDVLEQMLMRDGFQDGASAQPESKGSAAVQQMSATGAPVMNFPEEDTSASSYFSRKQKKQSDEQ